MTWTKIAYAHHVPGHGASEGVRSINSLGGTGGRAYSRFLLLNEFLYNNRGLNPGITDTFSLLGEYAPIADFSFALQAPLIFVRDRDSQGNTRVGYGDNRLQLHYTFILKINS